MVKSIALALSLASAGLAAPSRVNESVWPGWKGVQYMFVFGDSYTQTGFDVNGAQPNPSNPMGNPPYPGWTSSNGPNWVGFLTQTYNESYLQTYNMAYGGATVDSDLVEPYDPSVISMKQQVQDQYLPTYGDHPESAPWTASDSLFAFWIGINDIGNSWWLPEVSNGSLYDEIFSVYDGLLEQIYETGARNFLFLNVPPVNLAPLTLENGDYAIENEGKAILDWNARVEELAESFNARHGDTANTFIHDTHALYQAVIEDPTSVEQTSDLKNVTGYCAAYASGTPEWDTKDESCAYPVDEYLWLNELHPTYPMHNATADSIVEYLNSM